MTVVLAALFGLQIGSFLTVVVDRVPDGRSIVAPGSACGSCGMQLGTRDLVPVFSWLALRGKCRGCGARIGVGAIALELACAALWAAMAVKFGARWALAGYLVLVAGLLAQTWIDFATQRLPRRVTYVTAALGVPFLIIDSLVRDEPRRLTNMVIGAAIAGVAMGVIYLASRGGMGDGDVRLAPLLGAFLGWINLPHVPIGLFLGFLFGALVGVAMMAAGSASRKTALPFGPFLAAGTVVAVLAGQPLVEALGWV
jgi:leader peptidase (prepilin peptidase)/N-methyltransferase